MLSENYGIIEIGIVFATFIFGVFYIRTRMGRKKYDPEQIAREEKRIENEIAEAQKIHTLDEDLKEIEKDLSPHLEPSEKLYNGKAVLKLAKPLIRETELISLEEALKATRSGFFGRIKALFADEKHQFTSDDLEAIEEVLYTSDLGPQTVQRLLESLTEKLKGQEVNTLATVKSTLKSEMISMLQAPLEEVKGLDRFFKSSEKSNNSPEVWMVVGVNGAGKTTTIGKLAYHLAVSGKSVMIAAGDTFRAAASEQLKVWSERAKVEIFAPEGVESPSAVAFDAVKQACASKVDHLIVDTAGRLHTQKNLMDELKKVKRVIEKAFVESGGIGTTAPHEILLVLDSNSGQNALVQAKEFNESLDVSGIILTKLDGTAKGGVAVGIANELHLPIKLIGVGEAKEDLRPFEPKAFVEAIL